MDRNERLYDQARVVCWELFGLVFDDLGVRTYPRLASIHVANGLLTGDGNVFKSLKEVADKVHIYNRNQLNVSAKITEVDPDAGRIHAIENGIAHLPGRSDYERVSGRSDDRPAGPVDERRSGTPATKPIG